jgi:hypothetical protein
MQVLQTIKERKRHAEAAAPSASITWAACKQELTCVGYSRRPAELSWRSHSCTAGMEETAEKSRSSRLMWTRSFDGALPFCPPTMQMAFNFTAPSNLEFL